MQSPCEEQAAALRQAIDEWVEAAEATREYLVKMPSDPTAQVEPLHPGFFRQMQEAHERERKARMRNIRANNSLYECMERHNLIE
ncbi:MAG: hypothetical protein ACE5M4_01540 [Anaerolineales bacterium]